MAAHSRAGRVVVAVCSHDKDVVEQRARLTASFLKKQASRALPARTNRDDSADRRVAYLLKTVRSPELMPRRQRRSVQSRRPYRAPGVGGDKPVVIDTGAQTRR